MQVYVGGRLVGHLNVDVPVGSPYYRMQKMDSLPLCFEEDVEIDAAPVVTSIDVPIKQRRLALDDSVSIHLGAAEVTKYLAEMGVPINAKVHSDHQRHSSIYTWRVFEVDQELHEELFDMDAFEPV